MAKNRSRKETISDWLTRRHQLILRNEENFEEKTTLVYNNAKAVVLFFSIFLFIFLAGVFLQKYYFSKWGNDGLDQSRYRIELTNLSVKIDSVEKSIEARRKYMEALGKILDGGDPSAVYIQEEDQSDTATKINNSSEQLTSDVDNQLRKEFEDADGAGLEVETDSRISEILLFPPVDGYAISKHYNVKYGHHGVDILAKENQLVSAVANGTIVFSEWTIDGGNTVVIQHNDNLISVYKHNAVLLKKMGDLVQLGDPIAVVGNSGGETSGHHLHFELWLSGESFDPETVISF